jgi:GNAT superfamily N-acetyltransferase
MSFQIESFDRQQHSRTDFSCGQPALDAYLTTQISQDMKRGVATAFVLTQKALPTNALPTVTAPRPILGYYTLSAWVLDASLLDTAFAKKLPRYPQLPATLLGRLAVDRKAQGQRLGEVLLIDALARSFRTTQQIASLAVVTDAIDDRAANFYMKYGFQPFQQDAMKLYIPMDTIASLAKKFNL